MLDQVRRVLEDEPDLAFALVFGSAGRGALRATSDVDVAVEFRPGASRDRGTLGRLAARLESAARRRVDLVLLDSAPATLTSASSATAAYSSSGITRRLPAQAQAILQYLDFKPVEERCAEGVLRAAASRG